MKKFWGKLTNQSQENTVDGMVVNFSDLTKEQRDQVIQKGAKKFSEDFTDTIVKLANE